MQQTHKYLVWGTLGLALLALDQGTKVWASSRLATPIEAPRLIDGPHAFTIEVPPSAAGTPLSAFLHADLVGTPPEEIDRIAAGFTLIDGARPPSPEAPLAAGQVLTIQWRQIEVVPDFFHFRYTRNPGAAFSFLANAGALRVPFFLFVSTLATVALMFWFHRTRPEDTLLLASIAALWSGAVGNLIDRALYGWVIDFIDWHYYRSFTWPTFNIADAAITVGMAMLLIDMVRQGRAAQAPEPA